MSRQVYSNVMVISNIDLEIKNNMKMKFSESLSSTFIDELNYNNGRWTNSENFKKMCDSKEKVIM